MIIRDKAVVVAQGLIIKSITAPTPEQSASLLRHAVTAALMQPAEKAAKWNCAAVGGGAFKVLLCLIGPMFEAPAGAACELKLYIDIMLLIDRCLMLLESDCTQLCKYIHIVVKSSADPVSTKREM